MLILRALKRKYRKKGDIVFWDEETCKEIAVFTTKEKLDEFVKSCLSEKKLGPYPFKKGTLLEGFHHVEVSNYLYGVLPIDPE